MEKDTGRILIVDDDPEMLRMLKKVMERKSDFKIDTAKSGFEAAEIMDNCCYEVVITDIKMPDIDGIELLEIIKKKDKSLSIIMMTGFGTVDLAVEAVKKGAYDFFEKPFDNERIVLSVKRAFEHTRLLRENFDLNRKIEEDQIGFQGFIGNSPPLKKVCELIKQVADTDVTVLIRGESGTGKEVAARAIHELSSKSNKKMLTINCPALPENILESELFGYRKGAFTGATKDKKGLFISAHNSTILLDEIGDIPIPLQTKLLRVLQEGEVRPLGQNSNVKVDVRVIASTNQPLEEKIKTGEFREDLFYRLNVVSITMPPLRELSEDIGSIAKFFLEKYSQKYKKELLSFSREALNYIVTHHWPGNVRELQNVIKRAVVLVRNDLIELSDIQPATSLLTPSIESSGHNVKKFFHLPYKNAKDEIVKSFAVSYISHALETTSGNVTAAARKSGIERQALQRLIRRYGIVPENFRQKG